MKNVKSALSILLTIAMLLVAFPLSVSAATGIEIYPYMDGWENWGGGSFGNATQLLICLDKTDSYDPNVIYDMRADADFEIKLRAQSTGQTATIHMAPSSAYLVGTWGILRFETCEGIAPNRFVPRFGETYSVQLNIYRNGVLLYTGSGENFYCGMEPVSGGVPVAAPRGILYSGLESAPVFDGSKNFTVRFLDEVAADVSIGDEWTFVYGERRYTAVITDLPLTDGEEGYALSFRIGDDCKFANGKSAVLYLECLTGFAEGFYVPIPFTAPVVKDAPIRMRPHGYGFENKNGVTELLIRVDDTAACTATELYDTRNEASYLLTMKGGTEDVTVSLLPIGYSRDVDGGVLHFAPCDTYGESLFVPICGVSYDVELWVITDEGSDYVGTASRFLCNDVPYVFGRKVDLRDEMLEVKWILGAQTYLTYCGVGDTPIFRYSTERESDAQYNYRFTGWDQTVGPVYENVTFVARYEKTVRTYPVSFTVNGVTTETQVPYGVIPQFDGSTELVDPAGEYLYTFIGWSPALHPTLSGESYTALYAVTKVGELAVVLPSLSALVGDEITVPVRIVGNKDGYEGFSFGVSFDPTVLSYIGGEITAEGSSFINETNVRNGVVRFGWTALGGSRTEEETVALLRFAVLDVPPDGSTSLLIDPLPGDGFFTVTPEGTEEYLYYTATDGLLTVNDPSFTAGDINNDGVVSIGDVTSLLIYLATEDPTGLNAAAMDLSGDGIISISDVTDLLILIASQP